MKLKELIAKAEAAAKAAEEALAQNNMDTYKAEMANVKSFREQAEALKSIADEREALGNIGDTTDKFAAARPPFETADAEPEPQNNLNKSVYHLRYGDTKDAEKAVLKGLYGSDYEEKRYDQGQAFVKYLRTGKLSSKEENLLKHIIVLPEHLTAEIQKGTTVGEIKATLNEGVPEEGGYTVPEDFRTEIVKRMAGLTVVRPRARVVTTIRDAAEWPKLEGGDSQYTSAVRVTWIEEVPTSATVALTNPTFGMYRVPVNTVMARTDISRNLLEDSAFNMLSTVADLFAEALAIDEDAKFLTGTGGGTPRGILGNRSGANETPEDGITSVNSGNANLLTADGLIDLVYELAAQYRRNAVVLAAKSAHKAIRKLKDGNGDYLWEKGIAVGQPPNLLGYEILEDESMPSVAANNYPVVFGDLSGYLIADRVGLTIERVTDTTTTGQNKVAIFMRRRLGGQVIEPWKYVVQKVSA